LCPVALAASCSLSPLQHPHAHSTSLLPLFRYHSTISSLRLFFPLNLLRLSCPLVPLPLPYIPVGWFVPTRPPSENIPLPALFSFDVSASAVRQCRGFPSVFSRGPLLANVSPPALALVLASCSDGFLFGTCAKSSVPAFPTWSCFGHCLDYVCLGCSSPPPFNSIMLLILLQPLLWHDRRCT
jgi:hypothetical protein